MTACEQIVYNDLVKDGCTVYSSGWPDFLIVNPDGTVRCIEVKSSGDVFRGDQLKVHEVLRSIGIKVDVVQFGVPGNPSPGRPPEGCGVPCPGCNDTIWMTRMGTPRDHAPCGPRYSWPPKNTIEVSAKCRFCERMVEPELLGYGKNQGRGFCSRFYCECGFSWEIRMTAAESLELWRAREG